MRREREDLKYRRQTTKRGEKAPKSSSVGTCPGRIRVYFNQWRALRRVGEEEEGNSSWRSGADLPF